MAERRLKVWIHSNAPRCKTGARPCGEKSARWNFAHVADGIGSTRNRNSKALHGFAAREAQTGSSSLRAKTQRFA
jgi:hypothetical protein